MPVPPQLMDVNLYDFIFKTILQLPRCVSSTAGFWSGWGCIIGPQNFAHDFIISLLLPHIIILIFIYGTSRGLLSEHSGLGTLFGLSIYIFVVYSGWYAIFAKFTLLWLVLTIFFSFYVFVVGKIFPPSKSLQLSNMFANKKSERALKARISSIEAELRRGTLSVGERNQLQKELHELRNKLAGI